MRPQITLHHAPQSRSMRVLWLLQELGLEYQLVLQPLDKSLRDPGFLARSPAGRVPCLEINGQQIIESGAMIEYLCERFDPSGLGRAPDHPERVDWLSFVHFAETITQHAAALTQQHVILFQPEMRSPTVMKIERARLRKCYEALENHLSRDGRAYLLAGGFSAADLAVGQAVYMGTRFAPLAAYPALSAWYARLQARPGFQAALPQPGEPLLYTQELYDMPEV
ncbi:MAG: glutathione S-transferase family protein [Mangrovicoccus sp.]|nr:glutathione S-transferase family protein [Mangrovicoccus sp.]